MRKEPVGECWHNSTTIGGVTFTLYNSGHITGASQLLIENGSRILYTGDLSLKGGFITPPANTPKCDVLIIEATFGTPRYIFPDKIELIKEMRDWAAECLSEERTPVFLGYSLGKAQELTKAFSRDFRVYVEDSVFEFNKKVEGLGVDLGEYSVMSSYKRSEDCILIVPPHKRGLPFDDCLEAYASGWAVTGGWGRKSSASTGFPLSDHCDFYDLLKFVEKVSPQVVYTTHGFASEFSRYLRERGFYSEPLSDVQTKLDRYTNLN